MFNLDEEIIIEPLSDSTLNKAIEVLDKVFGKNPEDRQKYVRGFNTSLGSKEYIYLYKDGVPPSLKYYVAIDTKLRRVVGTTGLYEYEKEKKENSVSLGWYCVDPRYRGSGIGSLLLDFTLQKAKDMGKTLLCLWTSSDTEEKRAQEMYKRRGFRVAKEENGILHMELRL